MNMRNVAAPLVFLSALALSTGCLSSSKDNSLSDVDDLLTRIEKVHLASEVARERMHTSVDTLHSIVSSEYGGDVITAYDVYLESIEASEKQAEKMRKSIDGMRRSAERVFDSWAQNLESISSQDLRRRSQARLTETRERYQLIAAAAQPAQSTLDVLNQSLRDHAMFLAHDMNPTSVTELEGGVRDVTDLADELDGLLANCMAAAQDYVLTAAPPGEIEAPEDTPKSGTDSASKTRRVTTDERVGATSKSDAPSSGTTARRTGGKQ